MAVHFEIVIPEDKLDIRFSRSSGAGGQGVNRTESKVEIRFQVDSAYWIPTPIRERLKELVANQINSEGELLISSQESRSQNQNYEICLDKLRALLREASIAPKERIATKATRSSKRKRVDSKKKHSRLKATRKRASFED